MRYRQTLFFIFFLLCNLILAPCFSFAQENLEFSWALLQDTPEGQQALDASIPISLANKSTLQIFVEQQPGVYIYLYLLDSEENLYFLFPKQADFYSMTPPANKKFTIPADPERFELVPPAGQEKIYLMASAERLADLEKLTAEFLANPEDKAKKTAVIQEMKKIRHQHSKLSQITEKSVPVAGTIRTRGEQERGFDAIQVKAEDFYGKILRINHE